MNHSDGAPWARFAALQVSADSLSIDQTLARDEAFDEILIELILHPAISEERTQKRFANLCRNRASKYVYRRKLEKNFARPSQRRGGYYVWGSSWRSSAADAVFDEVSQAELMTLVRTFLPQDEFELLWELAQGKTYRDLAAEMGISVASVKSRVFRARKRISLSALGSALRSALA